MVSLSDDHGKDKGMRKIRERIVLLCVGLTIVLIFACTYNTLSLKIDKSLPPEKLARYNEPFSINRGIWGKIGFIRNVSMRTNFKPADMSFESGRMRVETKIDFFSSGGISSKFFFRGDFDVQVDCYFEFLTDTDDMDQVIYFIALDQTTELEDDKLENVSLELNKGGKNPAFIFGAYHKKGKWIRCYSRKIGDLFKGTLRIVRIGDHVSLLYKAAEKMEWQKTCSLSRPNNDTRISIGVQNYRDNRVSIDAKSPFTAQFDNFKINAAQEIIEDEV
jgi:hypothetical protein